MGNWNITIQGVGAHGNRLKGDAEQLYKKFVEEMKQAGHSIVHSSITSGGAYFDTREIPLALVGDGVTDNTEAVQGLINERANTFGFGRAIEELKAGKKVARTGWNGKGMWVVLMPSLKLPPHSTQEPGAKVNDRTAKHIGVNTPLDSQPYVAMWTAAKQWQPGWLASQADILAEDWQIVE